MHNEDFQMSTFDPSLPGLAKAWREDEGLTLHQAKVRLGMSVGYISDLENGNVPWSDRAFLRYHRQSSDRFPLALASQLDVDAPAAASNSGQSTNERGSTMNSDDNAKVDESEKATEEQKGTGETGQQDGSGDAGVPTDNANSGPSDEGADDTETDGEEGGDDDDGDDEAPSTDSTSDAPQESPPAA